MKGIVAKVECVCQLWKTAVLFYYYRFHYCFYKYPDVYCVLVDVFSFKFLGKGADNKVIFFLLLSFRSYKKIKISESLYVINGKLMMKSPERDPSFPLSSFKETYGIKGQFQFLP